MIRRPLVRLNPTGALQTARSPVSSSSHSGTTNLCKRPLAGLTVVLAALALACGPKAGESGNGLTVSDGRIFVLVEAPKDTLFTSLSQVMAQERVALRRYDPDNDIAETGFIDLAAYPNFFDQTLWDDTERMIKLRLQTEVQDSAIVLMCEPYYNPYEVVTHETDFTRLRLVPLGHPGFEIAMALTRRIAAHAEGRAVTAP
jgi:hypothetical protein